MAVLTLVGAREGIQPRAVEQLRHEAAVASSCLGWAKSARNIG
jgi:hypothetical protein